jgi:hypothetical protein
MSAAHDAGEWQIANAAHAIESAHRAHCIGFLPDFVASMSRDVRG